MASPLPDPVSAAGRHFHYDTRIALGTSTVLVGGSGDLVICIIGSHLISVYGVGKTTALVDLIKGGEKTLAKSIDELLIVYTQAQPAYMEMAAHVPVVKLIRLVDKLELEEFVALAGEGKNRTLGIIFDDVEQSKGSGIWRVILESVTRLAHHLNAYVFFTTHLLFVEKNEFRVVQRNAAYIVLFPSVRERSSVAVLARRCFPDRPEILTKAFEHLLRNADRHSYIVLDLRPRVKSEVLRVRHSFRLDAPLVAYLSDAEVPPIAKRAARRRRSRPADPAQQRPPHPPRP